MKSLIRLCDHVGKLIVAFGVRPLGDKYINDV